MCLQHLVEATEVMVNRWQVASTAMHKASISASNFLQQN